MPIEFRCSQCNQLLRVPETSAGKNARCPKCQALMQVPLPAGGGDFGAAPPPPPMPSGFASAGPPSFAEPTPPPVATGNDPFAFLNQGGGSRGGSSSPPPPPKNPFGDGGANSPFAASAGASTTTLNPYSSPSFASGGYSGSLAQYGPRSGLPWEVKRQNFSCWWETMALIISSPSQAFVQMRQYGGLGPPIMFNIWALGMPLVLIFSIIGAIALVFTIVAAFNGGEALLGMAFVLGVILFYFVMCMVSVLMTATISMMISAAILHVSLMIVGGARQGYETTFRVNSFAYGSTILLGILLACIPFAHAVWLIALLAIGLSKAHEIPTGKAVFAVLLPVIATFVLCFGLYIMMALIGVVAANA